MNFTQNASIEWLLEENFKYTQDEQDKIKKLKQFVEECKELSVGTENVLLTKFLNYSNWHVEEAFHAMLRYYDFKHRHPDWVAQHSVEHFRELFYYTRSKYIMPKPDKHGRAIIIFKTVDAFEKYPNYLQDIAEMDDLIFESLMLLPNVQKFGVNIIYDLSGTTRRFLRLASPSIARVVNEKNDILPFTTRVVHLIQKGILMNVTSNLLMPFISKEFKETMFTHDIKNLTKLREMIGYDSVPAEYGGPKENICNIDILYNHLLRHSSYLLKLQSYKKNCKN